MASKEQDFADLLHVDYGAGYAYDGPAGPQYEGEWNFDGGDVDHGDDSIVEPGNVWPTLLGGLPTVDNGTAARPYSRIRDKAMQKRLLARIGAGVQPTVTVSRHNRNADRSLDPDPIQQYKGIVKSPKLPSSDANSGSAAMYTIEMQLEKVL